MIEYTVDDWWSGEVCLNTCPILYDKDFTPINCSINAFAADDKIEIRKIQKAIWVDSCNNYYADLRLGYVIKSKNTKFIQPFLEKYLFTLQELLNPYSEFFIENNNKVVFELLGIDRIEFEPHYFKDYKMFIENYLINGTSIDCDFIHSPNCSYQLHKKGLKDYIPQVYAYCNSILLMLVEKDYNKYLTTASAINTENKNKLYSKLNNFKNHFDETDKFLLVDYFYKELVDSKLLIEIDFFNYIKHAFELQRPPIQLFRFKSGVKKNDIHNIFYKFYKEIATKTPKQQIRYAELLCNYFVGYNTKNVMKNFKRDYIKPINK